MTVREKAAAARGAGRRLAAADTAVKNAALSAVRKALDRRFHHCKLCHMPT